MRAYRVSFVFLFSDFQTAKKTETMELQHNFHTVPGSEISDENEKLRLSART